MAKLTINGQQVKVKNGSTILQACNKLGIDIPTLCFIEEINEIGFCRICVVEVEGEQDLVSSCNTEVTNGMVIHTDSEPVVASRKATLGLLASRHRFDCWRCPKDGACEFYDLLKEHDVVFSEFGGGVGRKNDLIEGVAISQDQTKCVLCKRCVAVCQNVVTANVLKFHDDDGLNPVVSPAIGLSFDETGCVHCGQCVKTCPTGTLFETDHTEDVLTFLRDENNHVVVQLDKHAASAVAEEFGYDINTPLEDTIEQTYQALELLGFDTVTNTDLGEDLYAMEAAGELEERLAEGTLPLFTTTCPATVSYFEQHRSEYLPNLATKKSPHLISGALLKHNFLKDDNVSVVTVGTCTAKKYEITRDESKTNATADVNAVLTVRELVKLMKLKGINYRALKGSKPDNAFTTDHTVYQGGTLTAILNVFSEQQGAGPISKLEFKRTRAGLESDGIIEEAQVTIGAHKLRVAKVYGGAAFKEMFQKLDKKQYHLVEFMMCPGGCMNGGGMPVKKNIPTHDVLLARETAFCHPDAEPSNPVHNDLVQSLDKAVYQPLVETTFAAREFRKE